MLPDKVADDFSGGQVDILIGIDRLYDIILWDQIALGDGLRAVDTMFGYVIPGVQVKSLLKFCLTTFTLNITFPKVRYHSIVNEMA